MNSRDVRNSYKQISINKQLYTCLIAGVIKVNHVLITTEIT